MHTCVCLRISINTLTHTHARARAHTHRVNLGISGFLMIRKEASGEPFKAAIALPGNTTSNKARIDAHAYTHTHVYRRVFAYRKSDARCIPNASG